MPYVSEQARRNCQQQQARHCGIPEGTFPYILQMIEFNCTNPHIYIKYCSNCSMLKTKQLLAVFISEKGSIRQVEDASFFRDYYRLIFSVFTKLAASAS